MPTNSALTWERKPFDIQLGVEERDRRPYTVTGPVAWPFGLDRRHNWTGVGARTWHVTHLPTGLLMGHGIDTLRAAKAYVAEILPLADWEAVAERLDRAPPGVVEAFSRATGYTVQSPEDRGAEGAGGRMGL